MHMSTKDFFGELLGLQYLIQLSQVGKEQNPEAWWFVSCASLCASQPECFAFSFSRPKRTYNMCISDECHNILTNGSACTNEYDFYCRGIVGVSIKIELIIT